MPIVIIIVLEKCAVNQGANGDVNKCPIGKLYHRDLQQTWPDSTLCNQADLARQIILKLIGTTFWICIFAYAQHVAKSCPFLAPRPSAECLREHHFETRLDLDSDADGLFPRTDAPLPILFDR